MSHDAGAGFADLPGFIDFASSRVVAQYLGYSGIAVWLWDMLLTLDEEIDLIWKRNRSAIKVLYLINRYLPALSLSISSYALQPSVAPTNSRCRAIQTAVFLTQTIQIIISPTIFVMRVYTISSAQSIIRWLLIAITTISNLYLLAIVCTGLATFIPTVVYVPPFHMCLGRKIWMFGAMYYIPVIVDTAVFLATVYHSVIWNRNRDNLVKSSTNSILHRLYVDGALYYMIVLSIRVASCIMFLGPSTAASLYTLGFMDNALTSVVTSRWLLSFRRTLVESLGLEGSNVAEISRQENGYGHTYRQYLVNNYTQSRGYDHVRPNRKSMNVNVSIDVVRSFSGPVRPSSREAKEIELGISDN